MFPDKQSQTGSQPLQQPYQPASPPAYGINSVPQQAPNGQYQVVPPPSITGRPSGHNPYEFIVNPNTQPKRGGLFGGNKFLQQIVFLVGGALLFMVVAALVISAVAPRKNNSASLTTIAQQQQEIIRIATIGAQQATGSAARNFATNVELSIGSNQKQVLAYLATTGTVLKGKQLSLDQNPKTDILLTNATAASTFDSVMSQTLTSQLANYQASLRTAYTQATNPKAKQILQTSYNAATLLLAQAKSTGSG